MALVVCAFGLWAGLAGISSQGATWMGPARLLGIAAAFYLLYRFWTSWRSELLWSLRNRLMVAYLFIGFVPILLILILASIGAQILYSQLAAYLLYHDIEDRTELLGNSAAHIAAAEATLPPGIDETALEKRLAAQVEIAEGKKLLGLKVNFDAKPEYFRAVAGPEAKSFAGLVQTGAQLRLVGLREAESPRGRRLIELSVPINPDFLEGVAPDLGPIEISLVQRVLEPTALSISKKFYKGVGQPVLTRKRRLLPPKSWIDPEVDGFSQLAAVYLGEDGTVEREHPVFAFFRARRSELNRRIFASIGELSGAKVFELELIAAIFLLIEIAAAVIGGVQTRAITRTVSDLYNATQFVQAGNFSHRVRVERKDQLGALGESFNSMTNSISRLIDEQKHLQRLENEISIAREVQDQLFPRNLPQVVGVEIEAICRAARSVSGDYYDFIQLSESRVAMAIADISGKGISAALLMASLQAALRSQLLTPEGEKMSTAELVARLNKHLVRNTGDDRFATFFVAVYDIATRRLRYTNAGHLPGFCLWDGKGIHLDKGGIVLGVVEDYAYQEGCVVVPEDAVLIGYSDGLVEPENAYGEEFGVSRLEAAAQRVRQATPKKIAESLMTTAEEWSGSPEQADDMTVIVVKLK
ncbi:MAG TPA: SpoIIE family protein phosphatase [Candidatus Acidoferrum sp.]|nr:SpoIIE family protein phosphatase [Candidatus Acidoferrum sp.]